MPTAYPRQTPSLSEVVRRLVRAPGDAPRQRDITDTPDFNPNPVGKAEDFGLTARAYGVGSDARPQRQVNDAP